MKKYLGLVALGLMAVVVVAPTFAREKGSENALTMQPGVSKYVDTVGKEITKGGLTVSIQDMLLDNVNRNLTIVTEVRSEEGIESVYNGDFSIFEDVYINGRYLNTGNVGCYEQVDSNTARATLTYPLEQAYEGNVKVNYKIKQIQVNNETKLNKWHFEATVNGDQLAKDTQVVILDQEMTLPNGQEITFTKYTSNVLGQKLYYNTGESLLDSYIFEVRAFDKDGKEVKFEFAGGYTGVGGVLAAQTDEAMSDIDMTNLTFELYVQALPEQDGPITAPLEKVGESFTLNGK